MCFLHLIQKTSENVFLELLEERIFQNIEATPVMRKCNLYGIEVVMFSKMSQIQGGGT